MLSHIANEPCGGGCSYQCAIINGSEQCYCPGGFEIIIPGGTQCAGMYKVIILYDCVINLIELIDINECDNAPCSQVCRNTEGSFECDCLDGYRLQDDKRDCKGMLFDRNTCVIINGKTDHSAYRTFLLIKAIIINKININFKTAIKNA